MELKQAHQSAKDYSYSNPGIQYVVWISEDGTGTWKVTDGFDLDTFYAGVPDQNIEAAYENGQYLA